MAGQSSKDPKVGREKLVAAPEPAGKADARREDARARKNARQNNYNRNRRQWLITKIVAGLLVVGIVGGLAWYVLDWSQTKNDGQIPSGVKTYTYTQGQHNDAFNAWTENPPVGGFHNNVWQNCGNYVDPIGTGHGIHSLEHGAIWITYQPGLPQAQIDKLKALADSQTYILVSPFPGIPTPIVLSSWNHQLQVQTADDARIDQFIKVFKNNKTYTPEFGALCSNGTSINGVQATQTTVAAPTAAVTATP